MASRFWVGGTGTWDNVTTTHWAATTGGASGVSVPGSADTVTLDANSGGGTVTVNTTVAVISITCGAFTGTLDFSANNNNVTLTNNNTGFNGSGTGTRTINLGNGTWTLTGNGNNQSTWNILTTTNLTFNANSSTIVMNPGNTTNTVNFNGGGLAYSTLSISSNTSSGALGVLGASTFATLNISAPRSVQFDALVTTTITNAFNWAGTSGNEILVTSIGVGSLATVSVATGSPTMAWAAVRDLTFTGGATFTATSSFNLGHNSGITITAPTSGGGLIVNPGLTGGCNG